MILCTQRTFSSNDLYFLSEQWHLGFFAKEYTPLKRGFDSFYGCYAGRGDYWSHESEAGEFQGLDLWDGEQVFETVSN